MRSVKVTGLRTEYLINPLGMDIPNPRLSWRLESSSRAQRQMAYQVLVASTAELLEQNIGDAWDSGKVPSDRSIQVVYCGAPLVSEQRYYWKVRVWDKDGEASPWSKPAHWEMGLEAWEGRWISRPPVRSAASQPCPYLRRTFNVHGRVVRARLYVTALGLFEPYLNGRRVGKDHFVPGWTDYHKRLEYLTYDVTEGLREGKNAVGAILGDGWACGALGWEDRRHLWGEQPLLLAQLVIHYRDGRRQVVSTDTSWKVANGTILTSDIYHGEAYDARLELPGWAEADVNDEGWVNAHAFKPPKGKLVAKRVPPVRAIAEITPTKLSEPVKGTYVFDLGQNIVGWARLKVQGEAGTMVRLRFAERLGPDGTLYTASLRSARATDTYTLKGGGEEVYEPRFTFHGFQYVEVTGCPQRDERLGWTGNAQVFIRTACFNMDVAPFFSKWLYDLEDAQSKDGAFPHVAPKVIPGEGAAAWADAGILCPWTLYLWYGDTRVLETHYDAMVRWLDYMHQTSVGFIRPAAGFGDWLAPNAKTPGDAPTPKDLIGTAYFAHCARLMANIATVLGKPGEAGGFETLAKKVRDAFNRTFVTPGGRLVGDTQTAYLLALAFDLLPEEKREAALGYLVGDLEARGWHLSTGFVGTPLLAPTLSCFGRTDVAYKLLEQRSYPSWLFTVKQGATTMWERWDGWTEEGGFAPASMNSFNHYAYGSIGGWLYATVAGLDLDPNAPGYKHILIHPEPGGHLTSARAELQSMHGRIISDWQLAGDQFSLHIVIPANTTATVRLPAVAEEVTEGGRPLAEVEGVAKISRDGTSVILEVGSGTYAFGSHLPVERAARPPVIER